MSMLIDGADIWKFRCDYPEDIEARLRGVTFMEHEIMTAYGPRPIIVIDGLLTPKEQEAWRAFAMNREIYTEQISSTKTGELPLGTISLPFAEHFLENAPLSQTPFGISSFFGLFGWIGEQMNAHAASQPHVGRIRHFVSNFVDREITREESQGGIHWDCDSQKEYFGLIPVNLNVHQKMHYPEKFNNGSRDLPLLYTWMIYATSEDFNSREGRGTVFFSGDGSGQSMTTEALHGRIVGFPGEILHSLSPSTAPPVGARASFTLKGMFVPKKGNHEPLLFKVNEVIRNFLSPKQAVSSSEEESSEAIPLAPESSEAVINVGPATPRYTPFNHAPNQTARKEDDPV